MKQNYLSVLLVFLGLSLFLESCATIFGKSSYPLYINSTPRGARIAVKNNLGVEVFKGITPSTVILKSSDGYMSKAHYLVNISSTGYEDQIIPVQFTINGWYFGNILIGGFLGMLVVDPLTGAMFKLDNPPINATLVKTKTTSMLPELKIINFASIPVENRKHLVRVN